MANPIFVVTWMIKAKVRLTFCFYLFVSLHFGLSCAILQEISTIFLVLVDFDVYFPAQDRGSTWGTIISFCQVAFTISFLYYRVIGWLQVSIGLWSDVLHVAKKGVIEDFRPGKAWFLYAFLAMDLLLGSLQFYWCFFIIVPRILEVLA